MTAGEDQAQPLVGNRGRLVHLLLLAVRPVDVFEPPEELRLALEVSLAADAVDRPVAGDGDQPAGGIGRHAVAGPAVQGLRDGILQGVLGQIEVAQGADQRGEDAAVLLAEQAAELNGVGPRR